MKNFKFKCIGEDCLCATNNPLGWVLFKRDGIDLFICPMCKENMCKKPIPQETKKLQEDTGILDEDPEDVALKKLHYFQKTGTKLILQESSSQ